MVQSTEDPIHDDVEANNSKSIYVTRFSSESARQRDGSEHIGSMGSRIGHSDLIFLEGILPEDDDGILSDRSIETQAMTCFKRLEAVLAKRNANLTDAMKVEVQLTNMADRDVVDTVYREQFDGEYPPRTTIGVCSLPGEAAIQLDVIVADE